MDAGQGKLQREAATEMSITGSKEARAQSETDLANAMKGWKLARPEDHAHRSDQEDEDDDDDDGDLDGGQSLRDTLLKNMKRSIDAVSDESTYASFSRKHYRDVRDSIHHDQRKNHRQGTLLHSIIQSIYDIKAWKVWTKLVLDVAKDITVPILRITSMSGTTCFHDAVQLNNFDDYGPDFVKFICTVADDKDLSHTINAENSFKQTCIDIAIHNLSSEPGSIRNLKALEMLDQLMLKADRTTLARPRPVKMVDKDPGMGNLPLHDLVHINFCRTLFLKCTEKEGSCLKCQQKKSFRAISDEYRELYLRTLTHAAEKNPAALKKMNNAKLSPFLFHIHTRQVEPNTRVWGSLEFDPVDSCPATSNEDAGARKNSVGRDDFAKDGSERAHSKTGVRDEKSTAPKHKFSEVEFAKENNAGRDDHARDGSERAPGKASTRDGKSVMRKHKSPGIGFSKDLATRVSHKLLELCLSQKTFPDTCDCLFGESRAVPGTPISHSSSAANGNVFSNPGFPSSELIFKAAPLTAKTTTMHSHLPLEPMLACVELNLDDTLTQAPNGVELTGNMAERLQKDARDARNVRVERFFNWLRKERRVKRIVKLVVYDPPHAPCEDNVIINCLKGFDIRYLDWNKEDLSVRILADKDVVPNLRELWLVWSGRDSTLLGWANKEHGLRRLEKLKTLYITTNPGWEGENTNARNLLKFGEILKDPRNMPNLEVEDASAPDAVDDTAARPELLGAPKKGHIWLEAVAAFKKALKRTTTLDQRKSLNGVVRVAIIDDGVYLEDLETTEYITGGWHPDRRAPGRRQMNAWYSSEKKHGTQMAKLVQQVCPYVSLYIAKLDTKRLVYKSVAESAAEAIAQAIENKADVISMSWTIYQNEKDDGLQKLKDAIDMAASKDIIMFCASEDSGYSSYRKPYPACFELPSIKRIGSAGTYGERSDYVNPGLVNYLFPGEITTQSNVCSGSSAATALAAGLAGLILWCSALQDLTVVEKSKTASKVKTAATAQPHPEHVDFKVNKRMFGLFETLKSSTENPLINVTENLYNAAKAPNPAKKLVELCKTDAHKYFENDTTTTTSM